MFCLYGDISSVETESKNNDVLLTTPTVKYKHSYNQDKIVTSNTYNEKDNLAFDDTFLIFKASKFIRCISEISKTFFFKSIYIRLF